MHKVFVFPKLEIHEIISVNYPGFQMPLDVKCLQALIEVASDVWHNDVPVGQFHIRQGVLDKKDKVNVY